MEGTKETILNKVNICTVIFTLFLLIYPYTLEKTQENTVLKGVINDKTPCKKVFSYVFLGA